MHYTLGNLSDSIPGPTSPTLLSQLITVNPPKAANKFTAHGAVADTETRVKMDEPFANSYVIRQTQMGGGKGSIKQRFEDAAGNVVGHPAVDQESSSITKAQFDAANGHVTWVAQYLKAGDYTFQGGAG